LAHHLSHITTCSYTKSYSSCTGFSSGPTRLRTTISRSGQTSATSPSIVPCPLRGFLYSTDSYYRGSSPDSRCPPQPAHAANPSNFTQWNYSRHAARPSIARFGHFPQSPEYGDRFDNYYHRSRWSYDCLYCIDRSDRCHTVCPELASCSNDYASDFRLPTTQHHAGSRDQTSPRRPNTSHSAHPLTRHGITGPVHVPIDRLEADHYYGSARSSLHHALAAMTFEQIHFGLNPVSLALLVVPSRPARSHHISTPYTAMTIVGDTSDPQGSHQHGGFGCACLRSIMGC
jgi:hypothetical protein